MQLKNFLPVLSLAFASLVVVPGSAVAAQVYVTDQGHTEVLFGWSHSGVSRQHAEFTVTTGTLKLADDIEKSSIDVTIDASSVSTGFEALDKHMKSKDFLEVETYPEITFKSTSIKQTGDKTFDVTGDLTLHGVTKPVVLKAEMTHRGQAPRSRIYRLLQRILDCVQGNDRNRPHGIQGWFFFNRSHSDRDQYRDESQITPSDAKE